jgi:hypothetical protein
MQIHTVLSPSLSLFKRKLDPVHRSLEFDGGGDRHDEKRVQQEEDVMAGMNRSRQF